jgi:hypothetical protein
MSAADAKKALDACEEGIKLLAAQQVANQALVDSDNANRIAWEGRRNTANANWSAGDLARKKAQAEWQHRFDQSKIERINKQCGQTGCDSGWVRLDTPECHKDKGKASYAVCQRTDDTAREHAGGPKPPDFNDPGFSEGEPGKSAQNTTPINIACCANVATVIGSDVKDTMITQQNSCLKDKKDAVVAATAKEEEEKNKPKGKGKGKSKSKGKDGEDEEDEDESTNKNMIIVAIVAVVICLFISSISILLMVTMT